jgi:hypothetical protein
MTTALVVAASVLATLAIVLSVVLLIDRRTPAAEPEPAVEEPAAVPEPEPVRLDHDLHEVAARAVESPRALEPPPRTEPPRRAAPPPRTEPPPRATPSPSPNGATGSKELEALLAQALETACAIPGADAALVSVTLSGQPFVGTLGLARHEADRLASTLPSPQMRTRSIEIAYEYERERYDQRAAGRIERGVAVPVPGSTPALLAILTRAPAAALGAPQLELLEEIAHRLEPALAAVGDARAVRMPVTISVREVDRPGGRMHEPGSAEREEGHEPSQVDWFRRR